MEFNSTIYAEALNKALVGTDVGYAKINFAIAAHKVLNDFIEKLDFNQNDFRFDDWSNSESTISYKKHVIGRVSFKKQRGKFERGYFGGGCYKWTFKECRADFWNEGNGPYQGLPFEKMLGKIDEKIAEEEKKKQSDFEFAKEIYKLVREKCREANRSDVAILEIIYKDRYALMKALETSE